MKKKHYKKKIKKVTPDKKKQIKFFSLFKFLELFGVFLFIFGFHWLGNLVLNNGWITWENFTPSYFNIWFTGLISFLGLIIGLIIIFGLGFGLYQNTSIWIKKNWEWAGTFSLSLEERLNNKKVEELKLDSEFREFKL